MFQYSRKSALLATSLHKIFIFIQNKGKVMLMLNKYKHLSNERVFCYTMF